jgi:hypothetical protein
VIADHGLRIGAANPAERRRAPPAPALAPAVQCTTAIKETPVKLDPLTPEDLESATGGQILRNRSALDAKLQTQLQTLQDGIKDAATAATTTTTKQQEQTTLMMVMMMARRNNG